jgi:hypothetical protein
MLQLLDRVKFELDLTPLSPGESKVLPAIQTLEDDRQAVAARVRSLLGQANITEKRIKIGREYKARRDQLRRRNQHDCNGNGWYAEFAKPNPHPFSRRNAERHIDFDEAFGSVGHMWPKLPHPFRALHLLATFKLSDVQLKSKCLSGEISPNSTEGAIWKLGATLGKVQPESASKKSRSTRFAKPARGTIISEVKRFLTKASQEDRQQFIAELLTLAPVRADLQVRLESDQRARARANGQEKVLLLPVPTLLLPISHDLLPVDDATPEERQQLARERREWLCLVRNEVNDAIQLRPNCYTKLLDLLRQVADECDTHLFVLDEAEDAVTDLKAKVGRAA